MCPFKPPYDIAFKAYDPLSAAPNRKIMHSIPYVANSKRVSRAVLPLPMRCRGRWGHAQVSSGGVLMQARLGKELRTWPYFFLMMLLRLWYTSAPARSASLNDFTPVGRIMNSCRARAQQSCSQSPTLLHALRKLLTQRLLEVISGLIACHGM